MSERLLTPRDLGLVRDILDLTRADHPESAQERTFQLLAFLQVLVGCDDPSLQEMDSLHQIVTYAQRVDEGERWTAPLDELAAGFDDPLQREFWRGYWTAICSLPERRGEPVVVSIRSAYTVRERLSGPLRDNRPRVDELLVGYPTHEGRSARLLLAREAGSPFGHRELSLMELLLPHLTDLVVATVRPTQAEGMPRVTGREAAVLRHVALGLTNRQIGRALGISEATVRKHLEHSYQKLGVSSRAGAMTVLTRRTNTA